MREDPFSEVVIPHTAVGGVTHFAKTVPKLIGDFDSCIRGQNKLDGLTYTLLAKKGQIWWDGKNLELSWGRWGLSGKHLDKMIE